MKTVRLFIGMMLVLFMALAPMEAEAQKGHRSQHRQELYTPYWIPTYMVRENVRYVYFPDHEFYYDRWEGSYIYLNRGRWIVSTRLPYFLRSVNFNRAYIVGLRSQAPRPYRFHARHRANYRRNYRHPRHDRRVPDYHRSGRCEVSWKSDEVSRNNNRGDDGNRWRNGRRK